MDGQKVIRKWEKNTGKLGNDGIEFEFKPRIACPLRKAQFHEQDQATE